MGLAGQRAVVRAITLDQMRVIVTPGHDIGIADLSSSIAAPFSIKDCVDE